MDITRRNWKELLVVAVVAIVVICVADISLQQLTPVIWLRQVDDGVSEFSKTNPRILSISSSHGRSMDIVARELSRRTGKPEEMVSVTMEAGKATHFEFVLNERLKPLIEARYSDGHRVHDHLERAFLVTEWWDSCAWKPGRPAKELPSHAWTIKHYLRDVLAHGTNTTNRNYPRWHWQALFQKSLLVTDRGRGAIVNEAAARLTGETTWVRSPQQEAEFVKWWLNYNDNGINCLFNEDQMAAYSHIVDYLKSQGLEVTIVIFARKPGTISEKARTGTLARYEAGMRAFAEAHGARLIDISTASPLTDDDFMADFDHVNAAGNVKLANWLLNGDLKFLECSTHSHCPRAPMQIARSGDRR